MNRALPHRSGDRHAQPRAAYAASRMAIYLFLAAVLIDFAIQ